MKPPSDRTSYYARIRLNELVRELVEIILPGLDENIPLAGTIQNGIALYTERLTETEREIATAIVTCLIRRS